MTVWIGGVGGSRTGQSSPMATPATRTPARATADVFGLVQVAGYQRELADQAGEDRRVEAVELLLGHARASS